METNIISVKFEDEHIPRTFSGKSYAYYTSKKVNVGDLVEAPTKYGASIARVSETNIPEKQIENIKPYMKTINVKIDRDKYLDLNEVEEVA